MVNPDFHWVLKGFIVLLYLCIFCTIIILGPAYTLDLTTEWVHDHAFNHHVIELDEEVLVFTFFTVIIIGMTLIKIGTPHDLFCSIYPVPQLPPPKYI